MALAMPDNEVKQIEAASHIRDFLVQRGLDIASRNIKLEDNQRWVVFEHRGRQVGVDTSGGVWMRESIRDDWRCLAKPSTVSSALQAVDFLIKTTHYNRSYKENF
jgi:hypothetical protein